MRSWRFMWIGAGLLGIAACNPFEPVRRGTVYGLRSIDGQTLPAPYTENAALSNRMFADTLLLGPGGKGSWSYIAEDSYGGTKRSYHDDFTYTFTSDGHVEIAFVCPDNASCIAPPHLIGDATANGIVFSVSRISRAPLVFDRVSG